MSTETNGSNNAIPNLFHKIIDFIEPSLLGIIVYVFIILVPIVTGLIISKLSGSTSLSTTNFDGTFISGAVVDFNNLINAKQVNSILDYAFWAIAATIIYTIAHAVVGGADELSRDLRIRKYVWPKGSDRNKPLEMYIGQFVLRIFIGILILLYIFKVLPVLYRYINFTYLNSTNSGNIATIITYIFIEILILHTGVLLLRLFRMRNRVISI
jgi:hypothetical protein